MKSLYIGKTLHNDKDILIVTDGVNFSPISEVESLDELLSLSRSDIFALANNSLLHKLSKFSSNFIENQQVWGTGVTFLWSDEKINATPDVNYYKKIYFSDRPMFFLKGDKNNHSQINEAIGMRASSPRNIPEAELVAVFNKLGEVIGFTIGNDQTAISLEQENPLFQFQAKCFYKSHSFLPMIKLTNDLREFNVSIKISRNNLEIFNSSYSLDLFKKDLVEIGKYLFDSSVHMNGIFLFLGCNAKLPPDFTLLIDDEIAISSPQFPIDLVQKCKFV